MIVLEVVGRALQWASSLYVLLLLVRVIFDWAHVLAPRWQPPRPVLFVAVWVNRLTDPPVRFLRRYIKPVRLGDIALDVGFLLLFVGVTLLGRLGQLLAFYGMTH